LKTTFLILTFLIAPFFLKAETGEVFQFSDDKKVHLVGEFLSFYIDSTNKKSLADVLNEGGFKKSTTKVPNFGTSSSTFWVKFSIANRTLSDKILLALEFPELNEVTFYYPTINGEYKFIESGQHVKIKHRLYYHQDYIFDLNLQPNQIKTYYLKIRTDEDVILPVKVGNEKELLELLDVQDFIFGVYYGILFIMLFYNLGVYFLVKDKSYIYYIFYILFVGLVQLCFLGHGFKYFWTNSIWLSENMVYLSGIGSGIFVLLFASHFLCIKENLPKLKYGVFGLIFIYLFTLLFVLIGRKILAFNLINFTAFLVSIYLILISIILIKRGKREAKYFLFAWSWFFIGVIIFVLRNFGILPFNAYTYYVLQIGSSIGLFLLSLALADKIKTYRRQKEEAQKQVFEELKFKKDLIKKHNEELDKKVKDRTLKLEQANKELSKKNEEKVAMMKEIHHRVKNNLQIVNSLLRLQSHKFKDQKIIGVFEACQHRVVSMAMLHERMYKSDDIKKIDIKDHLSLLIEDLLNTYELDKKIEVNLDIQNVALGMKTLVPLGLIINEVITNALKYAFKDVDNPEITVALKQISNKYTIIIGDNGRGIEKFTKGDSFGNELISIFTEQINGTLEMLDKQGTYYKITFEKID
jgi:two-component sensor histidine kinase